NIIPVDFKPGHIMPVIRISSGMVTSLVFTDKAGQVWPVTTYTLGDPASFDVQWDKKSGVLMVQGKQLYGQSNIGVMLQGMQVPVMVTLILGQKDWDYLDYIQVQQYMPSDQGIDHPSLSPAPAYLTSILNGVPPAGAVSLTVSGSDAKVWSFDGHYVMLTQSTLLSPAWSARADGPNNYHAYELPTTPVIMLSNNGQIQRVTISSGQSQTPSDDLSSQNAGGL
ncbi:MAG: hypothetical protein EBX40_03515, partial [Gammaproteobacteria bacterium]|nr:hypothetical protein [Gammaproteobacteria bacterium]